VAAGVAAAGVPAMGGVMDRLGAGAAVASGATRRNREWAESFATFAGDVAEPRRWLVCDAMTSGGLLAAVPGDMEGWAIGRLVDGPAGTISVR
jgi:selenide,water dikinase